MAIINPPPHKKNNPLTKTHPTAPSLPERAVLVHVHFSDADMREDLDEFKELARSAGADPVAIITGTRRAPEAKYFVGSGKAAEIQQAVSFHQAQLVILNHELSPGQERNLERLVKCRVLNRTGLILDIFAQRARSFEGKLQVELALLKHMATRLVRGWTHLERQRGGIGLRGPGETQLETDRRLIRDRIQFISERLKRVRKQREQSRRARKRAIVPTVALVGYTNAGKSTLFNQLTGEAVYVANRLFATLDPTLRRMEIPIVGEIILADTVGFIRHLPHDLVEAFRATLEEVVEADLLLHVIDAHDDNKTANIDQVNAVLKSIHADKVPQISVYNKIDLLNDVNSRIDRDEQQNIYRVWISALAQTGLSLLQQTISEFFANNFTREEIILKPSEAKKRAEYYQHHQVEAETIDEEGNYHLIVNQRIQK